MLAIDCRISRPASTACTRCDNIPGVSDSPVLFAAASTICFSCVASLTPTQTAGSGSSLVRPSKTKRKGQPLAASRPAHSLKHAAVTPRAPPDTNTTSLADNTDAPACTARLTLSSVLRLLAFNAPAFNAISSSPPPCNSSSAIACARALGVRPAASKSIALTLARGHSSAHVLINAGRPASHAELGALAASPRPNSPPVSCTVTNNPPLPLN